MSPGTVRRMGAVCKPGGLGWVVVAAAAHAPLALLGLRAIAPTPPTVAREIDVELTLEGVAGSAAATSQAAQGTADREGPSAARVPERVGAAPAPIVEARGAGAGSTEGTERAIPGAAALEAPEGAASPLSLAQLGLDGRNHLLLPAREGAGDASTDAKERVQAALRAPSNERDASLGLGPEGPVLRALREATSGEATDVNGGAVFLAVAGADGRVTAVSFVSGTGGEPAWRRTAARALASLVNERLRLPAGAKGAEMELAVTSAWKLPSGNDPGVAIDLGGIPLKKGEGPQSPKVSFLNPLPRIVDVPLTPDGKNKVPMPVLQLRVFETTADPSDVGARPRRVVHARLVRTRVL